MCARCGVLYCVRINAPTFIIVKQQLNEKKWKMRKTATKKNHNIKIVERMFVGWFDQRRKNKNDFVRAPDFSE